MVDNVDNGNEFILVNEPQELQSSDRIGRHDWQDMKSRNGSAKYLRTSSMTGAEITRLQEELRTQYGIESKTKVTQAFRTKEEILKDPKIGDLVIAVEGEGNLKAVSKMQADAKLRQEMLSKSPKLPREVLESSKPERVLFEKDPPREMSAAEAEARSASELAKRNATAKAVEEIRARKPKTSSPTTPDQATPDQAKFDLAEAQIRGEMAANKIDPALAEFHLDKPAPAIESPAVVMKSIGTPEPRPAPAVPKNPDFIERKAGRPIGFGQNGSLQFGNDIAPAVDAPVVNTPAPVSAAPASEPPKRGTFKIGSDGRLQEVDVPVAPLRPNPNVVAASIDVSKIPSQINAPFLREPAAGWKVDNKPLVGQEIRGSFNKASGAVPVVKEPKATVDVNEVRKGLGLEPIKHTPDPKTATVNVEDVKHGLEKQAPAPHTPHGDGSPPGHAPGGAHGKMGGGFAAGGIAVGVIGAVNAWRAGDYKSAGISIADAAVGVINLGIDSSKTVAKIIPAPLKKLLGPIGAIITAADIGNQISQETTSLEKVERGVAAGTTLAVGAGAVTGLTTAGFAVTGAAVVAAPVVIAVSASQVIEAGIQARRSYSAWSDLEKQRAANAGPKFYGQHNDQPPKLFGQYGKTNNVMIDASHLMQGLKGDVKRLSNGAIDADSLRKLDMTDPRNLKIYEDALTKHIAEQQKIFDETKPTMPKWMPRTEAHAKALEAHEMARTKLDDAKAAQIELVKYKEDLAAYKKEHPESSKPAAQQKTASAASAAKAQPEQPKNVAAAAPAPAAAKAPETPEKTAPAATQSASVNGAPNGSDAFDKAFDKHARAAIEGKTPPVKDEFAGAADRPAASPQSNPALNASLNQFKPGMPMGMG